MARRRVAFSFVIIFAGFSLLPGCDRSIIQSAEDNETEADSGDTSSVQSSDEDDNVATDKQRDEKTDRETDEETDEETATKGSDDSNRDGDTSDENTQDTAGNDSASLIDMETSTETDDQPDDTNTMDADTDSETEYPESPVEWTQVAPCDDYESGNNIGTLFTGADEISGMVQSRYYEDVLWIHEDANQLASLYAMTKDGRWLGNWVVESDTPIDDWEDIAIEAVEGEPAYLWLGDIGNNEVRENDPNDPPRESIMIVRVREPDFEFPEEGDSVFGVVAEIESFIFTYPDEPHDAEAIALDPLTGDLYVFAKEMKAEAKVFVARAPVESEELEEVTTISMFMTTGADFSMTGDELLVRNYSEAFYWERAADEAWLDAILRDPKSISLDEDGSQAESICFSPDASGFYTVSERRDVDGDDPIPIVYYRKRCE